MQDLTCHIDGVCSIMLSEIALNVIKKMHKQHLFNPDSDPHIVHVTRTSYMFERRLNVCLTIKITRVKTTLCTFSSVLRKRTEKGSKVPYSLFMNIAFHCVSLLLQYWSTKWKLTALQGFTGRQNTNLTFSSLREQEIKHQWVGYFSIIVHKISSIKFV